MKSHHRPSYPLRDAICGSGPHLVLTCRQPGSSCQLTKHAYAQNHDEKADGDNNEKRKTEPTHYHGAGTDAAENAPVSKVLRYDTGCH